MKERYVLCVLSLLRDDALPFVYECKESYTAPRRSHAKALEYTGVQTNTAPVEYLIDLAAQEHDADPSIPLVNKIIYLCSKECRDDAIRGVEGLSEHNPTTEQFFLDAITKHVQTKGGPNVRVPEFVRVPYKTTEPAANLQVILRELNGRDAIVDVDTTGGLRDMVNLVTLAIEVLQSQPSFSVGPHPRLGTTVYASITRSPNYKTKASGMAKISRQNETYALSGLIEAVNAFVKLGNADSIKRYFADRRVSKEMQELCKDLAAFSDRLSICDVSNVPQLVVKIITDLNTFESRTAQRSSSYLFADDALARLNALSAGTANATSNGRKKAPSYKRIRAEALGLGDGMPLQDNDVRVFLGNEGVPSADVDKVLRAKSPKALGDALMSISNNNTVGRSELLFAALVPMVREDFVGSGKRLNDADAIIETIRWCSRHRMLQQALTLYKEKAPECMEKKGYLSWVERGSHRNADERNRAHVGYVVDLTNMGMSLTPRRDYLQEHGIRIEAGGERVMPSNVFWYATLNSIRNDVMHLREEDTAAKRRELARQSLAAYGWPQDVRQRIGCRYDRDGRLQSLQTDIENALQALEGRFPVAVP